MPGQM